MNNNSPVGIFDSGIGGLTVAKALCDRLPSEKIIYFGDTAHLPYGDKSPHSIAEYSKKIAEFLLEKGCKLIVIACNSASASGYRAIKDKVVDSDKLINVIDPVVSRLSQNNELDTIGLIGTRRTVRSGSYLRKFKSLGDDIKLKSLATPLLAPMIEEGFFNNNISRTIISSYLSSKHLEKIQALILGCTHYPLIENEISEYYEGRVQVINSANIVAEEIEANLKERSLLASNKNPEHEFCVSEYTKPFEQAASIFFGKGISLQEHNLWKFNPAR
jgi:glutamate racemase